MDWTNPDAWFPECLDGDHARPARKPWQGSGRRTNPRHVYGAYPLVNSATLLARENGTYHRTKHSEAFGAEDPQLVQELFRPQAPARPYSAGGGGRVEKKQFSYTPSS